MEYMLGEIDLERIPYLLSVDKLMEEMLAGASDLTAVDSKSEAVCCGVFIDTAQVAETTETTDLNPVCINNCRMFIENAG